MVDIPQGNFAQSGEISSAGGGENITPADAELSDFTRSLYIGVTGDLTVLFADKVAGSTDYVTLKNVAVGYHPLRVREVRAATTATEIVALF